MGNPTMSVLAGSRSGRRPTATSVYESGRRGGEGEPAPCANRALPSRCPRVCLRSSPRFCGASLTSVPSNFTVKPRAGTTEPSWSNLNRTCGRAAHATAMTDTPRTHPPRHHPSRTDSRPDGGEYQSRPDPLLQEVASTGPGECAIRFGAHTGDPSCWLGADIEVRGSRYHGHQERERQAPPLAADRAVGPSASPSV